MNIIDAACFVYTCARDKGVGLVGSVHARWWAGLLRWAGACSVAKHFTIDARESLTHASCKLIVNAIVQCSYGVIKPCKRTLVNLRILHCSCQFYNTGYCCKLSSLELCCMQGSDHC